MIISFVPVTNVSMAIAKLVCGWKTPIVMCEHAFISRAFANQEYSGPFRSLYRMLIRPMYNMVAGRLIMTAEAGKRDAVENWGIHGENVEIIHNPQDIAELRRRSEERPDHEWLLDKKFPVVIAAGRLTRQKGFDKLLAAFQILSNRVDVRLLILGRGELEGELRHRAHALGISEKVEFLGFQTNHLKFIRSADLFVLSSVWEAMPMVVAETMALGTPIVSFDCPSGPAEMLDGGDCGFLVADQDVKALAAGMEYALNHVSESSGKAAKAKRKVESYDVGVIARKYESVLLAAAGRQNRS